MLVTLQLTKVSRPYRPASRPRMTTGTGATVYALSYQQIAASIRAQSDRYNIQTVSREQKLIMVRARAKTEIYAVNFAEGSPRLLFSDAGPHFEIKPDGEQARAIAGDKTFVKGIEREWLTGPTPDRADRLLVSMN
jgi:hypothetical protein